MQVGLYTAFLPMLIYAMLGTSRPLSVSTTTALAILAGAAVGEVAPGGSAESLLAASATLTLLVGGVLLVAAVLRLGFVANFILRTGADWIQGRHRAGHRVRSASEADGHSFPEGFVLPQSAGYRQRDTGLVASHGGGWRRDGRHSGGGRAPDAAGAGAAGRGGERDRRNEPVPPTGIRSAYGRPGAHRIAVAYPAGFLPDRTALAGGGWHCPDELHGNNCRPGGRSPPPASMR